jgi:hypothetical protein
MVIRELRERLQLAPCKYTKHVTSYISYNEHCTKEAQGPMTSVDGDGKHGGSVRG